MLEELITNSFIEIQEKNDDFLLKKIDNQIQLTKKIIDIYNFGIKSNRITYQIIINTKNILQFNLILL